MDWPENAEVVGTPLFSVMLGAQHGIAPVRPIEAKEGKAQPRTTEAALARIGFSVH